MLGAAELAILLEETRDDPVAFNDLILCRPDYWSKQIEIARALADPAVDTVVVATGNSVGKSYLAGGLVPWWLYTRMPYGSKPGAQVVATAPSQTLVGTVLFKEMRRALAVARRAGVPLFGAISESPNASPQFLRLDNQGWECLGFATTGVERASGQHNEDLFVLMDEASGIKPEIWEGVTSLNPRKTAIFGNPLEPHTPFHKLWLKGMAGEPGVASFTVASTDSPDIHMERSRRGLADLGFLRRARRDYGEPGSPLWESHVAGNFPDVVAQALIPPWWLDRVAQAVRPKGGGPRTLAADLSGGVGGDRTVLLVRDRWGILEVVISPLMGVPETAHRLAELARRWGVPHHRIVYDRGGMIGRQMADYLESHGIYDAVAYHGSDAPSTPRFFNKRAEMAYLVRERLDPDFTTVVHRSPEEQARLEEAWKMGWRAEPPTPEIRRQETFALPSEGTPPLPDWWAPLYEELCQLRYRDKLGKIQLEPKEDFAKRLGRSPDLADAYMMSYAVGEE